MLQVDSVIKGQFSKGTIGKSDNLFEKFHGKKNWPPQHDHHNLYHNLCYNKVYSKCSKIRNTSCLPKMPRQSGQT